MALVACPECAREISDTAASCPQCGYAKARPAADDPQKARRMRMRQHINFGGGGCLLLAVAAALPFVGIGAFGPAGLVFGAAFGALLFAASLMSATAYTCPRCEAKVDPPTSRACARCGQRVRRGFLS